MNSVKLRDGTILKLNDEVETSYHPKCAGVIFTVFEINEYPECESGAMVKVHVRGLPERVLKSSNELGIDANWLKKIE